MKLDSLSQVQKPGGEGTSVPFVGGGDDFLSRVNTTIANFKEMLKMVKEMKGMPAEGSVVEEGPPGAAPGPGLNKGSVIKFLDLIIQQGHGDRTVGDVLEQAKPVTIKQIKELLKRA